MSTLPLTETPSAHTTIMWVDQIPVENDAHKIYKGLNGGNDFKHREAYKILAWELRRANLRDGGLNHAVNIPGNVARRTSDNSSLGNSVGSNNLSDDPDDPPTPQSSGPNSDLDGSLYEGRSRPIRQKLHRKNITSQKAMDGVTASGSSIHDLLDELWLEKMQAKEEEQKQYNTGKLKWIWNASDRRRAEAIQHWQAKMDLEQAKEDRKIIGQKLHRKNITSQKAMDGVTASGSSIHDLLDELRLEKMQAKEEEQK
ncbi:hypothetical protein GIB67_037699 [Kingdonia uniflora]|uniref:No apical meristem-associated C-terminal domain-containing protein n=1 Tax=Kingdonia uniflora TaxID=39325 RepID=A0A7J7P0B6_9MAGN|nr:hypothetical protein GIB67_037699 [Kingdonia uniflora]